MSATLILYLLFQVVHSSLERTIVGKISLSTCHQITGKTIVRSYMKLTPDPLAPPYNACNLFQKLVPKHLHHYFPCDATATQNDTVFRPIRPYLSMFEADIFNSKTSFPFVGSERVGEMSFEIETADFADVSPDFADFTVSGDGVRASREMWSDGSVSQWITSECNSISEYRAEIKISVQGTGYHQTLLNEVNVIVKGKGRKKWNNCQVAVAYTMETGQYMDLDELREAQPYSNVTAVSGTWSIDVEKPAEQSTRHFVTLRTPATLTIESNDANDVNEANEINEKETSTIHHVFQTPVHFRYQRAQSEQKTSPSCILPPQVFVRCNVGQEGKEEEKKEWVMVEQVVLKRERKDRKENKGDDSDGVGISTKICSKVPVGNSHQSVFVSYMTAFATFGGAAAIAFILFRV